MTREEQEEIKKHSTAWDEATKLYAISAREYFAILKLALLHVMGVYTKSSYETIQAVHAYGTTEVYDCAIDILKAMHNVKTMTREEIIEHKKKAIELYGQKAKEASIEDKLYCYEPKIEQLKDDIRLLEKEQ